MKMNRLPPRGRVQDYKTYQIAAPLKTHWRAATCAEISCPQYERGWQVRVENLTPEMLHAAKTSGRKYSELHVTEGETWLVFEAGQPCFRESQHRVKLDRQEIYIARDGDWRGNPTGRVLKHTRPEHWVEDFQDNSEKIIQIKERG
jgi:hypothetical protein